MHQDGTAVGACDSRPWLADSNTSEGSGPSGRRRPCAAIIIPCQAYWHDSLFRGFVGSVSSRVVYIRTLRDHRHLQPRRGQSAESHSYGHVRRPCGTLPGVTPLEYYRRSRHISGANRLVSNQERPRVDARGFYIEPSEQPKFRLQRYAILSAKDWTKYSTRIPVRPCGTLIRPDGWPRHSITSLRHALACLV